MCWDYLSENQYSGFWPQLLPAPPVSDVSTLLPAQLLSKQGIIAEARNPEEPRQKKNKKQKTKAPVCFERARL